MKIKRRAVLQAGAALAAGLPLMGCESVYSLISKDMGEKIPSEINVSENSSVDPVYHLLSRAAYGAWPGDLQQVQTQGVAAWIDEQLNPDKIDDRACDLRARRFETILIPAGACYDFKKNSLRLDIARHTLLRAIYSKRQLLEVMVGFWTDHFNISLDKGDCVYLKPSDDRLVIRPHALGKFRDLVFNSSTSPAMLVYLDGNENRKSGAGGVPNENYGRELLELHTMGVHGGYSQKDVYEVARCFTGWRLHDKWQRATVYCDSALHDDGEKHVLGHTIAAGGGAMDRDRVIDIVCNHPSTAAFIASKLAGKFLSNPSQAFVQSLAGTFTSTAGDIKAMIKVILLSDEFQSDKSTKLKRPFHFITSALRALGADTHAHLDLLEYLQRMGQASFQYPTPDGYPDDAAFWLGTLLWRWKFALAAASGQIESVKVDIDQLRSSLFLSSGDDHDLQKLFAYFCGQTPNKEELRALTGFATALQDKAKHLSPKPTSPSNKTKKKDSATKAADGAHNAELAALVLCSPAFQRY